MKPGVKTTELWVTVGLQLLMIGVTFGFWTTEEAQTLVGAAEGVVGAVSVLVVAAGPFVAAIVAAYKYISGRTAIKVEEVKKQLK